MPSGFINLHKPAGITSRTAIDHIARLARPLKVGHAGTLDPLATGVLVVGVGQGTRLIEFLHDLPKRYTGTFLLGRSSPTEDVESDVTQLADPPVPTREEIETAARGFMGCIDQRPPAYSALKVDGRRAYDLARAGMAVELAPRPVAIYRLEIVRYAYPELTLDIGCSAGTYVRSLGRDLAESLGTAAVMSSLVRTAVGPFLVADAVPMNAVTAETWQTRLQPLAAAVPHLPRVNLTPEEQGRVWSGLAIPADGAATTRDIAGLDLQGRLVSILQVRGSDLRPVKNFPEA